jgi:hypothetical protein
MCIYRLEVSYNTTTRTTDFDNEILNITRIPFDYAASGFGWRDLVFSFKNKEDRKACLEHIDDLGLRVTLYEKEAA